MKPKILLIVGLVLIVVGGFMISTKTFGPEPDVTCVAEGEPTSGYAIEKDGEECPLSQEDFEKVWEYENQSALPIRQAGLGIAVVGLICAVTGTVMWVRARKSG